MNEPAIEIPYRALEPRVEVDQLRATVEGLRREVAELRARLAGPERWEHRVVKHAQMSEEATQRLFDGLGRHGWKLVSTTDYFAVFRRPGGTTP